jgi:DinB superfamily
MDGKQFRSQEVAEFWDAIGSRLDEFVQLAASIDQDGLHWHPPAESTNSIAVLVVHTLGNMEENILEVLLHQPVGRDRDAEFIDGDFDAEDLQAKWAELRARLETALSQATIEELDIVRSHSRRGTMTGRGVLISAAQHCAQHYGQAELTRDLYGARFSMAGS